MSYLIRKEAPLDKPKRARKTGPQVKKEKKVEKIKPVPPLPAPLHSPQPLPGCGATRSPAYG